MYWIKLPALHISVSLESVVGSYDILKLCFVLLHADCLSALRCVCLWLRHLFWFYQGIFLLEGLPLKADRLNNCFWKRPRLHHQNRALQPVGLCSVSCLFLGFQASFHFLLRLVKFSLSFCLWNRLLFFVFWHCSTRFHGQLHLITLPGSLSWFSLLEKCSNLSFYTSVLCRIYHICDLALNIIIIKYLYVSSYNVSTTGQRLDWFCSDSTVTAYSS